MQSTGAAIRLSKAIKDIWKEIGFDSLAAILNAKFHAGARMLQSHTYLSICRSELDRVGQKIPSCLEQSIRVTRNDDARIQFRAHHDRFRFCDRLYAGNSVL